MGQRHVPLDRLNGLARDTSLTNAEAQQRLARFGPNDLAEVERHRLAFWADTAKDPMLWFLVVVSAAYALLGQRLEAVTLLVAIIPFVAMDAWLHRRTRASTRSLQHLVATSARVKRDGLEQETPAHQLVPGDLVLLRAGATCPADGVLLSARELLTEESALTGEAFPVAKTAAPVLSEQVEETAWCHAGTRIVRGEGELRVLFTGRETLYGGIIRSVGKAGTGQTPLQRKVGGLVRTLLLFALALCVVLALVRYAQGHGLADALISAATLAVAALPEEFPLVFVVFLGVGVVRLARRKALVRRAASVENIGRITCICSDKTGTVTEGRLSLGPSFDASGEDVLQLAVDASRDRFDPVDVLLRDAADRIQSEAVALFPYTEARRRETAVVRTAAGLEACAKGAAEELLHRTTLDAAGRAEAFARVDALSGEGLKVLAVIRRALTDDWDGEEPEEGWTFAGLISFGDAVRKGAREAVSECRNAGIRVLLVSGDHPATVRAVARSLGLGGSVVTGDELDQALASGLRGVDAIARALPARKVEAVRALQSAGELVAVTGDGVNDVPALAAADVGIAVGPQATTSARDVAAVVLLAEDFRTLVDAIGEGRHLFRHLKMSWEYLLCVHLPLVLSAALVPLFGFPLLYLPVHVVWLELIIHPTAMLVFQGTPAKGPLEPLPRTTEGGIFAGREWLRIVSTGGLLLAFQLLTYLIALRDPRGVEHARAIALAVLVCGGAALTVTMTGLRTRIARAVVLLSLASAVLLVQVPALARVMAVSPLHSTDWLLAIGAAVIASMVWHTLRSTAPRPRPESKAGRVVSASLEPTRRAAPGRRRQAPLP